MNVADIIPNLEMNFAKPLGANIRIIKKSGRSTTYHNILHLKVDHEQVRIYNTGMLLNILIPSIDNLEIKKANKKHNLKT